MVSGKGRPGRPGSAVCHVVGLPVKWGAEGEDGEVIAAVAEVGVGQGPAEVVQGQVRVCGGDSGE